MTSFLTKHIDDDTDEVVYIDTTGDLPRMHIAENMGGDGVNVYIYDHAKINIQGEHKDNISLTVEDGEFDTDIEVQR